MVGMLNVIMCTGNELCIAEPDPRAISHPVCLVRSAKSPLALL